MTTLLAIDPGYTESAYVFLRLADERPLRFGKIPNADLLHVVRRGVFDGLLSGERIEAYHMAIEKVAMGGMIAGQETFDTAMWCGRFVEAWECRSALPAATLIRRIDEKMALCHDSRAKDSNIRQALIDRYGPGKEAAIGRKKTPGPLYGVAADVWSALAVAVTWIEQRKRRSEAA